MGAFHVLVVATLFAGLRTPAEGSSGFVPGSDVISATGGTAGAGLVSAVRAAGRRGSRRRRRPFGKRRVLTPSRIGRPPSLQDKRHYLGLHHCGRRLPGTRDWLCESEADDEGRPAIKKANRMQWTTSRPSCFQPLPPGGGSPARQ